VRPIGKRESLVTAAAVRFANLSERELVSRLAHLRDAVNVQRAEIDRAALKRVARLRGISLPRVPRCDAPCCALVAVQS
jgi:hypothetical protein